MFVVISRGIGDYAVKEGDTLPLLGKSFSEHDPSGAQSNHVVRVVRARALHRACTELATRVQGLGSGSGRGRGRSGSQIVG